MRLIDADKLIEYIKICDIGNGINHRQKDFIDCINIQPIAYDIDKVIKDLEEWTVNANVDMLDGTFENHNIINSKNAIDIVKDGGWR